MAANVLHAERSFTSAGLGVSPPRGPCPAGPGPACAGTGPAAPIAPPRPSASLPPAVPPGRRTPSAPAPPAGTRIPPASSREPWTCAEKVSTFKMMHKHRSCLEPVRAALLSTCACSLSAPCPACAAAGCSPATSGPGPAPAAGSSPDQQRHMVGGSGGV